MQGVKASVLVCISVVDVAVNLKGRVLDAVGVASGNTAGDGSAHGRDVHKANSPEMGVLLVLGVVGSIVPTKNDVTLDAVNVSDEEVGDGCAIRDELGSDSLR